MRLRRSVTALSVLATLAAFTALPALPAYADSTTDTYIVQLKAGVSADKMVTKLMGSNAKVVHKVFQGGIVKLNATQAKALAGSPYVKSVHKDAVIHATDTQPYPPWDLDMLDSTTGALDNSYTSPNNGSGVTVYVLDSGIQRSHVEFSGLAISAGANFVPKIDHNSTCGQAQIAAGATEDLSVNPADTADQAGHGTAVSSLIVGTTLGAAKGVTLVPVRVLNCDGSGSESAIISAAEWIAANRVPGAPAVANLSFGVLTNLLGGDNNPLDLALQGLIDSGITVVAAAGNGDAFGGVDACNETPASLPGAITVAAVDIHHAETTWTNYGPCVDLYAPGELDRVAWIGPSNTSIVSNSGTSFSAPLTSAAAAIVLHDHPTWTPAQVNAGLTEQALTGVVIGQGGLPPKSANKLLQVTGRFVGTDPTITGREFVGEPLTASLHWTPTPTTLTYQWNSNGVAIPAATGATYVVAPADLGQSLTVTVTGSGVGYYDVTGTSAAVVPAAPPDPGLVVTMTPTRLLDTRTGLGGITGPLTNGQTVLIPVAGVGNIMSTASAALVNITVTDPTSSGYVTASAAGAPIPATSNANFTAGKVSANLALVPIGAGGAIALTVRLPGTVSLVVDVQSWVAGGGVPTDPGAVVPVTPMRLWDTRQNGVIGAGKDLNVQVAGTAGVPADATGVFLNVTVTEPQGDGYLTVYPSGENPPATSNLNFTTNLTVPNMVLVKVGANGFISIRNADPGTAHIVVDLQGYIIAGTPTVTGAVVPISPVRVADTRLGLGAPGPVKAATGVDVTVTGGPIPPDVQGVFMNLTVTETNAIGWVSAYPTQGSLPLVSNLNFAPGQTVPNLATVGLTAGQATLHNGSWGTVQIVADVFAYIL
jgi:subtilisin family serine protease